MKDWKYESSFRRDWKIFKSDSKMFLYEKSIKNEKCTSLILERPRLIKVLPYLVVWQELKEKVIVKVKNLDNTE